ncbi:MarR family winged helix-turn-helix transcriptional regulator [Paractinoplanes toevensis]|uniref:Uncharacterized protein n=1 Tax=Paractinoplanes toevensis TaxID=571911 RepID=A0A919T673_9ACTN|nr:MarR family winged helix-turn-helix transcriptional regulator [Actinoplanes toevensis]GIM90114.1 hypothetical protein Ato02nite_019070 [Actinoplanes toevensis]
MTETSSPGAHTTIRVLAALAELGETTAAAIAAHVGVAYSTTTAKLRTWEDTGQAERVRTSDGRTLWRLTDAGRAATATAEPHHAQTDPAPHPADQPEPDIAKATTATTAATAAPSDSPDTAPSTPMADDPTSRSEPAAQPPFGHDERSESVTSDAGSRQHVEPAVPSAADTQGDTEPGVPAATQRDATAEGTSKDATTRGRRARGSLSAAILAICQARPDHQYKVGELSRLIDANNAGTNAKRVSQGAVSNACAKLATAGLLTQTVDKPATFQLARTGA